MRNIVSSTASGADQRIPVVASTEISQLSLHLHSLQDAPGVMNYSQRFSRHRHCGDIFGLTKCQSQQPRGQWHLWSTHSDSRQGAPREHLSQDQSQQDSSIWFMNIVVLCDWNQTRLTFAIRSPTVSVALAWAESLLFMFLQVCHAQQHYFMVMILHYQSYSVGSKEGQAKGRLHTISQNWVFIPVLGSEMSVILSRTHNPGCQLTPRKSPSHVPLRWACGQGSSPAKRRLPWQL